MRTIPRLGVAAQGDPEHVLAELCAEAPELFRADGVALFVDDGHGLMRVYAAGGLDPPFARWVSVPTAEAIALAERDGDVSILAGEGTPDRAWAGREPMAQAGMRSAMWAPIRASGRIAGGLLVAHRAPSFTFDDDDRLFAEVLAEYLGTRLVELRLRRAGERLQAALGRASRRAIVGDLAWSFAHEIQHPVVAVLDRVERMLAQLPATAPLRPHADAICRDARRVRTMMDALLDFGTRDPAERCRSHASELVDTVLNLVGRQLVRDGILVEVAWNEDLPPVVCHPQQIEQVLLGLVTRARRALNRRFPSHSDEKVLRIEARLGQLGPLACAEIEVWDAGCGIARAQLERMLGPQSPESANDDEELWFGLAVCRDVVRAHDGSLHVESAEGAFTRVVLSLPLEDQPRADERE
jgi:signal transduction histidine kinase